MPRRRGRRPVRLFAIPGMVMSAKGLLEQNSIPTRAEAAFAIRNNVCRCTGYVKIIDAILLAAEIFRAGVVPAAPTDWSLGARVPRVDVREKVTGTGVYPDDLYLDGMIYGSAVRSEYPRARVLAIHTEAAKALPGVVCVLTAADIPGKNKVGHLMKDWDTMIAVGEITHYLGDAICLVAAETPEILARAKALVQVEYEELPMVRNPREAMAPDAPLVHASGNLLAHKHIQRGNPAEAMPGPNICSPSGFPPLGQSTPSWSPSAPWRCRRGRGSSSSPRIRARMIRSMKSWGFWACLPSRCGSKTSWWAAASAARRTSPCSTMPPSSPISPNGRSR